MPTRGSGALDGFPTARKECTAERAIIVNPSSTSQQCLQIAGTDVFYTSGSYGTPSIKYAPDTACDSLSGFKQWVVENGCLKGPQGQYLVVQGTSVMMGSHCGYGFEFHTPPPPLPPLPNAKSYCIQDVATGYFVAQPILSSFLVLQPQCNATNAFNLDPDYDGNQCISLATSPSVFVSLSVFDSTVGLETATACEDGQSNHRKWGIIAGPNNTYWPYQNASAFGPVQRRWYLHMGNFGGTSNGVSVGRHWGSGFRFVLPTDATPAPTLQPATPQPPGPPLSNLHCLEHVESGKFIAASNGSHALSDHCTASNRFRVVQGWVGRTCLNFHNSDTYLFAEDERTNSSTGVGVGTFDSSCYMGGASTGRYWSFMPTVPWAEGFCIFAFYASGDAIWLTAPVSGSGPLRRGTNCTSTFRLVAHSNHASDTL